MTLDATACYRALRAHDTRFDGRFFVAVKSTRIYCRPICSVKMPRRENCSFFSSAAAAEAKGFRPCLRCRPELAPGNASVDSTGRLARAVASAIDEGVPESGGLTGLARSLGATDRHLRRAFKSHFGVSPVAYAQTQRLLLAKQLLTDTTLTVTDVAFASGFGSLRRFNALFRQRYRLSPVELRKRRGSQAAAAQREGLQFALAFRPPYDWDALLAFLAARTIDRVEEVRDGTYSRSIRVERGGTSYAGWIAVAPMRDAAALRVTVSSSLVRVVGSVLARVKHLMDLAADPHEIAAALGPVASRRPGLRVPGAIDGFEIAVRAVLGQQVSVKAARTLAGRFAATFGVEVATPFPGVSRAFPLAADIAPVDVQRIIDIGVIAARARTIVALAREIAGGSLSLGPGSDVETTLESLRAIPGIGEWTAQYVVMRAVGWPDAFPHSDLGLKKALGEQSPRRILTAGEAWRPWRAYAAMHLWHSLS